MDKDMRLRLIILLIIIFGILGTFLLYNYWPNMFGARVVLDTEPYDPFDPLRGQYMQIRYEVGRLEAEGFDSGDKICVELKEDEEGIWRPGEVSGKVDGGIGICGEVLSAYSGTVRVEYDIERYYFEKGANVPTENVTVEVAVSSGGRARLIELLHNGEPVDIGYRDLSWRS